MLKRQLMTVVLFSLATVFTPLHADDVTDSIQEASEAYAKGDNAKAIESLNYAVQLIQQAKAKNLEQLLPQPLSGWTANAAESTAVGAAMFGGGITVEKRYTKGDSSISIQIVTDSPMLQGMMALFANPMFATSSGGKLEKVAGQKAISTYDAANQGGDYQFAVANQYMVTVKGEKVSADEMAAYAEGIDFKKME
ncbi:hypothetical protein SAMN02745130_00777 [Thiothrix eikelboomii]|uniref:Uncharacterized protein n=1 Tax=Thiothrix eikelboomii TaxID=92487 RepID=A0A1T4W1Z8_9GAMM|nr:hypothetical protein [Thiothrix eikelboomii]SKA71078.1 hypothetical protein SAMN02745130_00777 [Thiothrix eikelboomii]